MSCSQVPRSDQWSFSWRMSWTSCVGCVAVWPVSETRHCVPSKWATKCRTLSSWFCPVAIVASLPPCCQVFIHPRLQRFDNSHHVARSSSILGCRDLITAARERILSSQLRSAAVTDDMGLMPHVSDGKWLQSISCPLARRTLNQTSRLNMHERSRCGSVSSDWPQKARVPLFGKQCL
jgi:hypothetical protein